MRRRANAPIPVSLLISVRWLDCRETLARAPRLDSRTAALRLLSVANRARHVAFADARPVLGIALLRSVLSIGGQRAGKGRQHASKDGKHNGGTKFLHNFVSSLILASRLEHNLMS